MKFHSAAIALSVLGASGMNTDSNAASPNEKTGECLENRWRFRIGFLFFRLQ